MAANNNKNLLIFFLIFFLISAVAAASLPVLRVDAALGHMRTPPALVLREHACAKRGPHAESHPTPFAAVPYSRCASQ